MRPTRHRRTRPRQRTARRGLAAVGAVTAAVLVAGLAGTPGALADPRPAAASPAALFEDMDSETDLGPLLDSVGRNVRALGATIAGIGTTVDTIAADLADFAATLPALLSDVREDPAAGADTVQAALSEQALDLVGAGLPAVLGLVARLTAPSCYTLGAAAVALPEATEVLPLDTELFGPLAPLVQEADAGASDALMQLYTEAFATLIAPPDLPGGAEALEPFVTIASLVLSLLVVDVETTYYAPDAAPGDAPLVRNTPGLLGLPVLLDVDGRLGYDMCAITNADLATGEITQTISRLPLRKQALEVDLRVNFLLGFLNAGYRSQGAIAPTIYETVVADLGAAVDTALVEPSSKLVQTVGLSIADADDPEAEPLEIALALTTLDTPTSYTFTRSTAGGAGGSGTLATYTAGERGDSFGYAISLLGFNLGITSTPAPTELSYCTSGRGFCSDQPGVDKAIQTASMHLHASEEVRVVETPPIPALCLLGGVIRTACGLADVTAKDLDFGAKVPAAATATAPATTPEGNVWVDTNGLPASGNIQTGGIVATLPAATAATPAFQAQDRRATWTGVGTQPAQSKTGTITCPTGTAANATASLIGFGLSRYFCSFPPVNITSGFGASIPTISPTSPGAASVLTANPRTWTGAPNAPTFSYQWQRCLSAVVSTCTDIAGASGPSTTYTVTPADAGHRMRVKVTGTNLDGVGIAFSNPTNPVPGTIPVVSSLSAQSVPEGDLTAQRVVDPEPGTDTGSTEPDPDALTPEQQATLAEAEAAAAQAEAIKEQAQFSDEDKVAEPPRR
ncbi:MAG: hypothetical protein ACT4PP_02835 [Sporichthyaceae bacterium]